MYKERTGLFLLKIFIFVVWQLTFSFLFQGLKETKEAKPKAKKEEKAPPKETASKVPPAKKPKAGKKEQSPAEAVPEPKPKKERATKPAVKEESADEGKGDSGEELPAAPPKNTNKRAKKGKVAE